MSQKASPVAAITDISSSGVLQQLLIALSSLPKAMAGLKSSN